MNQKNHNKSAAEYTFGPADLLTLIPFFRSENAALSLPCTVLLASLSNAHGGQRESVHEYSKDQNLVGKILNLQLA